MNGLTEIKSCEVCGNTHLQSVLNLGLHPLCDDLVPIGERRVCREYPIEILFCSTCKTAHQRFQVPKRELFPNSYHYRARFTADVLKGMANLVDSCEKRLSDLTNKTVLDIGCNDGSLLGFFQNKGCLTVGVEPTNASADAREKGHIIYGCFLSGDVADTVLREHGQPDIITFTNVFAHIENLNEVIEVLRPLISTKTLVVIENHYLGSVLDGHQFDTFYHEHPRTYSLSSFQEISKNLRAVIDGVEFPSRYGGNIRLFLRSPAGARKEPVDMEAILSRESEYSDRFSVLQSDIRKWQHAKKDLLISLSARSGRFPAKAFPGRAAILLKLLGLDDETIFGAFEKPGSMKIGHYIPGTRIPILSDDELFSMHLKPPAILNLAWHISPEINSYLRAGGYEGEVIDVLQIRDFAIGE